MFKKKDGAGQESLFNVMKAYSVHDREVELSQCLSLIINLFMTKKNAHLILHSSQYNLGHCCPHKICYKNLTSNLSGFLI